MRGTKITDLSWVPKAQEMRNAKVAMDEIVKACGVSPSLIGLYTEKPKPPYDAEKAQVLINCNWLPEELELEYGWSAEQIRLDTVPKKQKHYPLEWGGHPTNRNTGTSPNGCRKIC